MVHSVEFHYHILDRSKVFETTILATNVLLNTLLYFSNEHCIVTVIMLIPSLTDTHISKYNAACCVLTVVYNQLFTKDD